MKRSLATLLLALSPVAQASVSIQTQTPSLNSTYVFAEDAWLKQAPQEGINWTGRRWSFTSMYHLLTTPLVETNPERTIRTRTLLSSLSTLDLNAGFFLDPRLSFHAGVSMNLVGMPDQGLSFGLGDSRVATKYRFTNDNAFVAIAGMVELMIPTGNQALYLSDGAMGMGLKLMFERDFGLVTVAANIGYRYSAGGQFADLSYQNRLPLSLAAYVPINHHWGANIEANGFVSLPIDRYNNPAELYAGARYQPTRDVAVQAGVAAGALNPVSGSEFRAVVGMRLTPQPEAPKVVPPPPAPVVAKRVVFTPKEIRISEEVKFEHNSSRLSLSGRNLLDEVAQVIKHNRAGFKSILIEGHTNFLGTYPYNQNLSEDRAASVKEYLTSRGLDAKWLHTIGYGKTRPKRLPHLSKAAQIEASRRVEFKVIN